MYELSDFDERATEDIGACTRDTVVEMLHRFSRSEGRVRIAPEQERMRSIPGTHFHLWPELFLQVSGVSVQHTPGGDVWLYPGEALIMPRGVPHTERCRRHRGEAFRNFVFMYTPHRLGCHLSYSDNGSPRARHHVRIDIDKPRRVGEYLDDAVTFAWDHTPHHDHAVRGLMMAHLEHLALYLKGAEPVLRKEHAKVIRCRELVMTNLTNPELTVNLLARWIHCAPDYLSHLFATETGTSLKLYINEQRIMHAKDLLLEPELNISEVARATGYADPAYFSRVFRKQAGCSPRQYRRTASGHG